MKPKIKNYNEVPEIAYLTLDRILYNNLELSIEHCDIFSSELTS
jgi:hypothetical protein